ncbi:hypothetical protein AB0M34_37105 [Nocardia sp. NPDC050193]
MLFIGAEIAQGYQILRRLRGERGLFADDRLDPFRRRCVSCSAQHWQGTTEKRPQDSTILSVEIAVSDVVGPQFEGSAPGLEATLPLVLGRCLFRAGVGIGLWFLGFGFLGLVAALEQPEVDVGLTLVIGVEQTLSCFGEGS